MCVNIVSLHPLLYLHCVCFSRYLTPIIYIFRCGWCFARSSLVPHCPHTSCGSHTFPSHNLLLSRCMNCSRILNFYTFDAYFAHVVDCCCALLMRHAAESTLPSTYRNPNQCCQLINRCINLGDRDGLNCKYLGVGSIDPSIALDRNLFNRLWLSEMPSPDPDVITCTHW